MAASVDIVIPVLNEDISKRLEIAQTQMEEASNRHASHIAEFFKEAATGLREQSSKQTEILETVLAQLQQQNRTLALKAEAAPTPQIPLPPIPENGSNGNGNGNGRSRWGWLLGRKGNNHVAS